MPGVRDEEGDLLGFGELLPGTIVLFAVLTRPDDDAGERVATRGVVLTMVLAGDCDLVPRDKLRGTAARSSDSASLEEDCTTFPTASDVPLSFSDDTDTTVAGHAM